MLIATNPAMDLEGVTLPSGWIVRERIDPRPGDTGGFFSINYWVENSDGTRGFCKILNYWWLLTTGAFGDDPLHALAEASSIYEFERDLARECASLSRVVTALADGTFSRPGYLLPTVHYIIFEVADGDIRRVLDESKDLDVSARLRAVHNLAAGVRQLHGRDVAHQDIKPSNTLVFPPIDTPERITKVGDLGRATVRGRPAGHDDLLIAGDSTYAPPEGLYGAVPIEFGPRRLACDLYQLGSMLSFIFTAVPINGHLTLQLHPRHHWDHWNGTYAEVYPYVLDAFGRAVGHISASVPAALQKDVRRLIESLCHPDVSLRGHPQNLTREINQYKLDRIVTQIDLLSRRARILNLEAS